jgi:hypothetical protein
VSQFGAWSSTTVVFLDRFRPISGFGPKPTTNHECIYQSFGGKHQPMIKIGVYPCILMILNNSSRITLTIYTKIMILLLDFL